METRHPVSVIMTVFNGERYLQQAIDSVLGQSLADFEFVIVDDGSDDGTPEILAAAAGRDSRVRVITQPRLGRARALNVAWERSTGAFIANLDADDLAEPERLARQYAYLQQHPQVGLLGTGVKVLRGNAAGALIKHLPLTDPELRRAFMRGNPFVHSSAVMPRSVLEELGGYNESFAVLIDYELWVRIAGKYEVANLPDALVVKRVHQGAYFQNRVSSWTKAMAGIRIRWSAWRTLSRPLSELHLVVLEPIVKWLSETIRLSVRRPP